MSNSRKKLAASLIAAALLAQIAPISVLAAEETVSPTDLSPAVSPSDTPTFHEALKDKLEFFTAVLPSYHDANSSSEILNSGSCGENLTYSLTSDGVLTISGEGEMTDWGNWGDNRPPWYSHRDSITSVHIPSSVTSIGYCAFYECDNITDIFYHGDASNLKSMIHDYYWSRNQGTLHVDSGTVLDSGSCGDNVTYSLTVDGIMTIEGSGAIWNYDGDENYAPWLYLRGYIKDLRISDGITSIGKMTFCECRNLSNVSLPNSLQAIGNDAFSRCSALKNITFPNHLTYIGENAFENCALQSLVLPDSLAWMGQLAFAGSSVKSVVIPTSITYIATGLFEGCGLLTEINYKGTADEWKNVRIESDNRTFTYRIRTYGVNYNYGNILVEGKCGDNVTGTLLKDGRLILSGSGATYDYNAAGTGTPWQSYRDIIKSIQFSTDSYITHLGYGIFQGCYKAEEVTIPDTVTSIGGYAFSECASIKKVVVPDSITILEETVFNNCGALEEVTLPKNLTSIGRHGFSCTAITGISLPDTLTTIKGSAFNSTPLTSIDLPDSITTIESHAFSNCDKLKKIVLPNALPSIEYGTFINCKSLETITIPRSVTSIAKNAFGNDTGEAPPLTDVYYGGSEYDWSKIVIDSGNDALTNATIHYTEYDVKPDVNGAASKLYEPWGFRYFAAFDGADSDKIADRGIAILKESYYTDGMTPEAFCADDNAFVFRESAGKVAFDSNFNAYYATLEKGIYSYDIAAKYYVVPFAELNNGETVYGSIKSNSMENILNTNLGRDDVSDTEKAVARCILALKESVAAHYAAEGIPGASADLTIPRGNSQSAASSVKTTEQSGVTPNIYAGASRLIEPWGLRYFASCSGSTDSIKERGVVILKETDYQESYSTSPDSMRLNANAYIFRSNDGTLVSDDGANYYATVSQGISSENISDVYYVVPFVVLNDDSYVYGTVKSNSMLNIMNANLQDTSIPSTEKAVTEDIVDLYNAVKAHYAS